jgi:hypothetical protein
MNRSHTGGPSLSSTPNAEDRLFQERNSRFTGHCRSQAIYGIFSAAGGRCKEILGDVRK